MQRMTPSLLSAAALALCCGCSNYAFSASRTESIDLSAAQVVKLWAETHNGDLVFRGAETDAVRGTVELVARGATPAEAEDLLALMEVEHRVEGGVLTLGWRWSDGKTGWRSGDVSFSLEIPRTLAAELETHNGRIELSGSDGDGRFVTHNGDIAVDGVFPSLQLETHNGSIRATLAGSGAVVGHVETHNGDIDLAVSQRDARLVVDTHNGSIQCLAAAAVRSRRDSHLEAGFGAGSGMLRVRSHNGDVEIR
ncbi:MAG: DUF4097 family beta strand repeat-containing protein [Planctomycetota bacterium]